MGQEPTDIFCFVITNITTVLSLIGMHGSVMNRKASFEACFEGAQITMDIFDFGMNSFLMNFNVSFFTASVIALITREGSGF